MSIFIDLEMNTTDARLVHKKDLRNEVIEIGAVRMDDTFHPLDRFRIFVRPQYNGVIERKIYKLTGISNGAVSDAVSLPEALDALEAWCGSDGCEIYAWSTSDLCQLRKECGFKGIDSVFLTRWCSGTIFRRTSGRCWERKTSSPSATPCTGQGWSRKAACTMLRGTLTTVPG